MQTPTEPAAPDAGVASVAPLLHLELLGVPGLVNIRGERMPLERRAAALLALLAIDGARPRADLAALLWPGATLSQARNSLRQRLFRLQRAAGTDIVVGHEELRLADAVRHDLGDAAERLAADPQAHVGELLDGLDYADTIGLAEWVDAARERWRQQRSSALAELAARHESRGEIVAALRYARRVLADEPLLEHSHRRVMRLHYLRGDRSAALQAYERCRQRLRDELGATPDRETIELARLIGSGEASRSPPLTRTIAPPTSVLRPPQLSGRHAPRAQLAAALAEQRVLVLHGEPGIGKTRLLEDAADTHAGLLATGAQAGDGRVPYALLARIARLAFERVNPLLPDWVATELARLLPALGPAPSTRLDPLRLQQAFGAALEAWAASGVKGLIVDDLHHADDASLECLLALAADRPPGLAWVFGVRSHEMPAALEDWLAASPQDRVQSLALPRLDAEGVKALIESLGLREFEPETWCAPLMRHTGGNPLFALETVRALLALGAHAPAPGAANLPVPAGLDALIQRRLARLSEPALKLARVAALAGTDFDADVAAQVLETHPLDIVEPWRELQQAQLLDQGRLSHDLIAEALLRALPDGIAQALHARLASGLETLGRASARVAPHWAAAQAWSRAGEAFAMAARDARRASRRSDEMLLWDHAADGFDRAGQPGKAFEARADSVECVILVRGVAAAMVLVDRLAADQRTEPQHMRALTARATVCLMAGQATAGEAAARSALDLATRLGAQWPRFEAARLLAVALAQADRPAEALQAIEPFHALVTTHGDAEQRHRFWADYAYALKSAQRAHETADALRQAMASAQEAGDLAELATLTSNLALVEGNLGRVQSALDHARSARALSNPVGVAVGPAAGAIELYVSVHEGALGRYAESLAGFERAEACFAGNADTVWIALAANHKANVLIHLGQFARARQALQYDAATLPTTAARRVLLHTRIDRALAHRGAHSIAGALAELGENGDPLSRMLTQLEASLALSPAAGADACAALAAQAQGFEHVAVALRARMLRIAHLTLGHAPAGDEVEAFASDLTRLQPADTYFAEAWWTVARAFDALGRPEAANGALRAGFDWVAQRALPQVPPAFRDSFLNRNAINRELLAAAARRLGLRIPAPSITPR